MSLVILFHFLCAQHISDINISIIRSLRLCCWITTSVVLFSVRCVLEIWCGWFWVVFVLQAEASVKNHKFVWCICRGHNLKHGRRNHTFGVRLGSVFCIHAISVRVHSPISYLVPHPVRRCTWPDNEVRERATGARRGSTGHAVVPPALYSCPCPSVRPSWELCHESPCTVLTWLVRQHYVVEIAQHQSKAGWNWTMPTSRGFASAVDKVRKVPYALRLRALCFGLLLGFHVRLIVKINA